MQALTPPGQSEMSALGSLAEGQEFFVSRGKPPCGFRDRSPARLMVAPGWETDTRYGAFKRIAKVTNASFAVDNVPVRPSGLAPYSRVDPRRRPERAAGSSDGCPQTQQELCCLLASGR